MLIKAPLDEVRAAAQAGEVEMASLAAATFVKEYQSRSAPQGIFRLLSESESARVLTWVAADPANREVIHAEVSTAEWFWTPSKRSRARQPRPALPVVGPAEPVAPPSVVSLADQKRGKVSSVDHKTDDLIANGFTVAGKVFSASDAAQLKWLGIFTSRAVLTYPLLAPTKDDMEFITLADEDAVVTFYTAIVSHVQDKLKSGILLKQQIAGAADQAAFDAIVDNRT